MYARAYTGAQHIYRVTYSYLTNMTHNYDMLVYDKEALSFTMICQLTQVITEKLTEITDIVNTKCSMVFRLNMSTT